MFKTRSIGVSHPQQKLSKLKFLLLAGLCVGSIHAQINGNIQPAVIEIDADANLYPDAAGFVDWVKDSAANTDPASLVESVATGLIPNVTSASGGTGHWYGVRVVDGIAGGDQDIFLTGGKENDVSSWNVGPGSVGSAKYDITQAYLANNSTRLFFGMERRGNDGTTAFDFEFNVNAPGAGSLYVPTRTIGDVLFTFEMQGSGKSGSATPHYYVWNGTAFIEQAPLSSLVSTINNGTPPSAPWGYVTSKGDWAVGNIPRFEFAEASVLLTEAFPTFVACNSSAFVQVRTRSSSTASSDLKDTTKIFEYIFGSPQAKAAFDPGCDPEFTYTSAGSKDSAGGASLTYLWSFKPPTGVTLGGTGVTGPDASGFYHSALASGKVTANIPAGVASAAINCSLNVSESGGCDNSTAPTAVTIYPTLTASASKTAASGTDLSVTATATSNVPASYQWQRLSGANWVNLQAQTGSSLVYTSFETDATPSPVSFSLSSEPYVGKLYEVQVRVVATRAVNGVICEANSPAVTLKKIIAVDP